MKSLFLLVASVFLASTAYAGEKSRYYLIGGQVKECEIGQDGEPLAEIAAPSSVLTAVTSYRTVCENGVCRTIAETSYVESDQPNAGKPIVNPNYVANANEGPAVVSWATPTGVPMVTNSTCTSCGSAGVSQFATNTGAFPFVRETAQHFAARPKLFSGKLRTRIAAFFGR